MNLLGLIAGLMALSWLLPNHYPPWTAAWGEGLTLVALCLSALWVGWRCRGGATLSRLLLASGAIGIVAVAGQYLSGRLIFFGDALMVVFYLGAWLIAACVGSWLGAGTCPEVSPSPFVSAWLLAAIVSVGIGLLQWTGSHGQNIHITDLPPNWSPWSNVASRTHFASICFVGVCCLGWLHQTRRIGSLTLALGVGFLLLGMVMSTARTAWLQMAWLVPLLMLTKRRSELRLPRWAAVALALGFAGLVIAWPSVADIMLLSSGRTHEEQLSTGFRLRHWIMMIEAIGRAPWFGWGWTQVSIAQQVVALDFPPIGEQIDSSHNLVLDLLLWNGIPIGLAIVVLIFGWFFGRVFSCRDGSKVWLLAAIGGLLGHAMVEYPLQYAYFLIPAGLMMGVVDAPASQRGGIRVPRLVVLVGASVLALVLLLVGRDYLRAEEAHRTLRLESARIGVDRIVTPAPRLEVLTQLDAYLELVRIEPTPAMDSSLIDRLQLLADRFGNQTMMFNAALAAGLNNRPTQAADQLARICHIHQAKDCSELLLRWQAVAAGQYPALQSIVLPDPPQACRTPGMPSPGCT